MLTKFLKSIHNFFLLFGINVSFVKKESLQSPILHNSEEEMNKFWGDPKNKKNWLSPELIKFYKLIIAKIKEKGIDLNNENIADIGCGTGTLLYYISQNFSPKSIEGYDFSDTAIKIAKEKLPLGTFIQHDIYKPLNKSYYFVFCTEVLEHILYPDKAINNLLDLIQPKGHLFISVPDGRKDTFGGHINFWSQESWDVFIRQQATNLKVETGELAGFGLYAWITKE